MDKLPITKAGEKDLAEKLRQLKTKDRPEIAQAIAEARAHGDLKENAEYHAAKEQQGFIEAKIQEIEHALANAQVIDVKDNILGFSDHDKVYEFFDEYFDSD